MYLVTAEEMRRLDHYVIEEIGIPAAVLMENAGRETAREVCKLAARLYPDKPKTRWLILAGKGNNGGDGLVAARHLCEAGLDASVVYADAPERFAGDAAQQRDIAARLGIPSQVYGAQPIDWPAYDGVIDALLGTGAHGAPREPYAAIIREANASGLPIVAVDIPSGLDADTGMVWEPCIRSTMTVALACLKRGLMQHPGAEMAGEVVCAPIGIPARLAGQFGVSTFVLDLQTLRERLGVEPSLPRRADTHKGTYGHALIAAGSWRMSGAALLAAKAALRAGCGLATLAVPDRLLEPLIGRVPELMLAGVPDGGRGEWASLADGLEREAPAATPGSAGDAGEAGAEGALSQAAPCTDEAGSAQRSAASGGKPRCPTAGDALLALAEGKRAVLVGPGMGRFPRDDRWLRSAWERIAAPLVIDADALNMLADAPDFAGWTKRQAATVLTPHPGEMARLTGLAAREVQHDRIGLARSYALEHGVTLVLKGARTVIATPAGTVYVNVNGNPGMATGGAGDVLAGSIAGLLAQGLGAEQAAALGVYLHGAAGDRAAQQRAVPGSLLAGEIADFL